MDGGGSTSTSGSGSGSGTAHAPARPLPPPSPTSSQQQQQQQQQPQQQARAVAPRQAFDVEAPPPPPAAAAAMDVVGKQQHRSEAWRDASEALAFCTWAAETAAAAYLAVELLSNEALVWVGLLVLLFLLAPLCATAALVLARNQWLGVALRYVVGALLLRGGAGLRLRCLAAWPMLQAATAWLALGGLSLVGALVAAYLAVCYGVTAVLAVPVLDAALVAAWAPCVRRAALRADLVFLEAYAQARRALSALLQSLPVLTLAALLLGAHVSGSGAGGGGPPRRGFGSNTGPAAAAPPFSSSSSGSAPRASVDPLATAAAAGLPPNALPGSRPRALLASSDPVPAPGSGASSGAPAGVDGGAGSLDLAALLMAAAEALTTSSGSGAARASLGGAAAAGAAAPPSVILTPVFGPANGDAAGSGTVGGGGGLLKLKLLPLVTGVRGGGAGSSRLAGPGARAWAPVPPATTEWPGLSTAVAASVPLALLIACVVASACNLAVAAALLCASCRAAGVPVLRQLGHVLRLRGGLRVLGPIASEALAVMCDDDPHSVGEGSGSGGGSSSSTSSTSNMNSSRSASDRSSGPGRSGAEPAARPDGGPVSATSQRRGRRLLISSAWHWGVPPDGRSGPWLPLVPRFLLPSDAGWLGPGQLASLATLAFAAYGDDPQRRRTRQGRGGAEQQRGLDAAGGPCKSAPSDGAGAGQDKQGRGPSPRPRWLEPLAGIWRRAPAGAFLGAESDASAGSDSGSGSSNGDGSMRGADDGAGLSASGVALRPCAAAVVGSAGRLAPPPVTCLELEHLEGPELGSVLGRGLVSLPRLRRADLRWCALRGRALRRALGGGGAAAGGPSVPALPPLAVLAVERSTLDAAAAALLARAAATGGAAPLGRLEELRLSRVSLPAAGAMSLASGLAAGGASRLRSFALVGATIEPASARARVAEAFASALRAGADRPSSHGGRSGPGLARLALGFSRGFPATAEVLAGAVAATTGAAAGSAATPAALPVGCVVLHRRDISTRGLAAWARALAPACRQRASDSDGDSEAGDDGGVDDDDARGGGGGGDQGARGGASRSGPPRDLLVTLRASSFGALALGASTWAAADADAADDDDAAAAPASRSPRSLSAAAAAATPADAGDAAAAGSGAGAPLLLASPLPLAFVVGADHDDARPRPRDLDALERSLRRESGGGGGARPGVAAPRPPCLVVLGPSDAGDAVALALKGFPAVGALRLSGLFLGHRGGRVVASALHCAPRLAALDLSFTGIGDDAAVAVAAALAHCPQLRELDLGGNVVADRGALAVAAALEAGACPRLARLSLAGNLFPLELATLRRLQALRGEAAAAGGKASGGKARLSRRAARGGRLRVEVLSPYCGGAEVTPPEHAATPKPPVGSVGVGGGSSASNAADDDTCGVCLDRPNGLHVAGCRHPLCVPCYRAVVLADGAGSSGGTAGATCPFCRGPIEGFVYSDPVQRAVFAQLSNAAAADGAG